MSWSIRWFKIVAVAEAVTYLVLLGSSVAKHVFDMPGAVPVMGPIHGFVFLAYLWLALLVREELDWRLSTTLKVVVAAVIPLGGLYVERKVLADVDTAAPSVPTPPPTSPSPNPSTPGTPVSS